MLQVIGAIVAIGLLIVVHESGHFFVARWCKMRVDRFSLGFGPGILRWRRGDTEFQLAPIPFGGFVQIAGMNIAEDTDPSDARAYPNRPAWQRFLTIFAGPATNYLFAIVLAFGLYATAGVSTGTIWYQITGTRAGYDAHQKFEAGDRIVKVDGEVVYYAYGGTASPSLRAAVQKSQGKPVTITVLRDGTELDVTVTPKLDPAEAKEGEEPPYMLGLELNPFGEPERVNVGLIGAAGRSLVYPVDQTKVIVAGLYEVIRGREKGELTGPVGITHAVKQHFQLGWERVIELLMLLNVYLGLFNLLPLPALDGGRLVFLAYEMATRRRANPKIEATVHMVGIMALLLLMVLVTFKDISRLL